MITEYKITEKGISVYVFLDKGGHAAENEADASDILSLCYENNTSLLMIHSDRLSERFFDLKSGFAGTVLQKLANYRVKTALILTDITLSERFREFLAEAGRGSSFHAFSDSDEAEKWLLSGR